MGRYKNVWGPIERVRARYACVCVCVCVGVEVCIPDTLHIIAHSIHAVKHSQFLGREDTSIGKGHYPFPFSFVGVESVW